MLLNADGSVVNDGSVLTPGGDIMLGNESLADRVMGMAYQAALDQPYLEDRPSHPFRGKQCVRLRQGMKYNNATGEYYPAYKEFRTSDLRRKGVNAAVWNANSLPRQLWTHFIKDAVEVHRVRLVYWAAIRARSVEPGVDPYKSTTIEYEAISDPGEAIEDMDVISDGRNDSMVVKTRTAPLPMQYMNWHLSDRLLRVSESNGRPITSPHNRAAARRIAELTEDGAIGNRTGLTFGTLTGNYANAHDGTSTNYGARTLPTRIQSSAFTLPTAGGWTPETLYNEVLTALQTMRTNSFYGPFLLAFGTDWWPYLGRNFSTAGGNNANETVMSMIEKIPDVTSVIVVPRLTAAFQGFITQADTETVSAIDAMPPTLIQWDSLGGAKRNFRTLACQGTIWKYDYNGVAAHTHFTAT